MTYGDSTAPDTAFLNPGKPNYPCDVVSAAYRASCWAYQSIILLALNDNNLRRTLSACVSAGEHEQECFAGFGKQAMGLTPNDPQPAMTACRAANPQWLAPCISGIVEYYTSYSWRADGTVAFCRTLTTSEKAPCYEALGREMGRMRPTAVGAEVECAKSEPEFVAACQAAADSAAKPEL